MGSVSSKFDTPLVAQASPVAAIHERFCSPKPTTLHVHEYVSFSGDDFTVRDVATEKVVYRMDGKALSFTGRKILLDADNQRIVQMRRKMSALFHSVFNICEGERGKEVLFAIESKSMLTTNFEVKFRNVVNGKPYKLGIIGDWMARAALIWIDRGEGVHEAVARIYTSRNVMIGKQDYLVDIAPNVDSALIVLVCVALDEVTTRSRV